jgi:hypothetical protein
MKILSIDVGIKNLSFCLFNISQNNNNQFDIVKWDIIDLSKTSEYIYICKEIDKNKVCDKSAKYFKDDKCYCAKHFKKQNVYLELSQSFINKQTIKSLTELAKKYGLKLKEPITKTELISLLKDFSSTKCFKTVEKNNASKVDLVTIGKNIQHKFDDILTEHIDTINTIIIENQIGPIANKMKTIQGMISQYFIMKNNNINIEFISATNKLKDYIKNNNITGKIDYKQRKKLGIEYCNYWICNNNQGETWIGFFNKHTKKDDLADCFLQGLWYINNKVHK